MTTHLDIADFGEFYRALHGFDPYPWQRELVRQALSGAWPERIAAPTGTGKSCVVEAHLFACAARPGLVPRRLAVVVDRRAIVDQHETNAREGAAAILVAENGILAEVRENLLSLHGDIPGAEPVAVVSLRGGIALDNTWVDNPLGCQIICATPQMFGSRILGRGYGSSRAAQPRATGLLTHDIVAVIDEAHLNRQLVTTARAIASMANADGTRIGARGMSVVELSATLPPGVTSQSVLGISDEDRAVLSHIVDRPKPVRYVGLSSWPTGAPSTAQLRALLDGIHELRAEVSDFSETPQTIGCVVSRVDTAVRLNQLLLKEGLRTQCLVGRMRACDAEAIRKRGVLNDEKSQPVDVLVATQTVEVGVDIDLAGLVTELAPGTALAQRAGRVNRRGLRPHGPVIVIGPAETVKDYPPYAADDLEAARHWILAVAEDPAGLAPSRLVGDMEPPPPRPRRRVWSVPNRADATILSRTSQPLFSEPDLSLWLLDDLESESLMVGIVLRGPLPEDASIALGVLRAASPVDDEVYPVSLVVARRLIEAIQKGEGVGGDYARAFTLDDEGTVVQMEDSTLRPGQLVILDAIQPVLVSKVITGDVENTYEAPTKCPGSLAPHIVLSENDDRDLLHRLFDTDRDEAQALLKELAEEGLTVSLPARSLADESVGRLPWAVLAPIKIAQTDEETRQTWSTATHSVELDAHLAAVGDRAAHITRTLGLQPNSAEAVITAARLHDDGKRHPRFQWQLDSRESVILAKSIKMTPQQIRWRRAQCGLPQGWRHEQFSVALAAPELTDSPLRDLTLRLIGTSHGRGRGAFQHGSADLLPQDIPPEVAEAAEDLFDAGEWDSLVERTEAQYGAWTCSYLEALVRASDAQVSKEGS